MMVRCCSLQSCCQHILPTFIVLCQQCRESHSSGWFDASVVTRFVSMVSLVNCPVVERLVRWLEVGWGGSPPYFIPHLMHTT